MWLERIYFKDFRCFYGEQEIDLTYNEKGNVTIIHAQNGVGKTNLLNAILWTFYEKTTGKFEQKNLILNASAAEENRTTAIVEIEFSFQNKRYRARRFFDTSRPAKDRSEFKMWETTDGNQSVVRFPEILINSIIPSDMADYFFFDGEHAETFAGEKHAAKVGAAVKTILGCEVAERAIEDIRGLRKKIETRMNRAMVGNTTTQLIEEKTQLESRISADKLNLQQVQDNLSEFEQSIADTNAALQKNEASKAIQDNYERTVRNLDAAKLKKQTADKEYFKWADTNALPLICQKLVNDTAEVIANNKKINKIPSKYSGPLVNELLENKECICGTCLTPGTPTYNTVQSLLTQASDDTQIERYGRVQSELGALRSKASASKRQLVNLIQNRQNAVDAINNLESALAALDKNYERIDDSEVTKLRNILSTKKNEQRQLAAIASRAEADIEENTNRLNAIDGDLEKAREQQFASSLLSKKVKLLDKAIDKLETELEEHIQSTKGVITHQVNSFLETAASKSLKIKINNDFSLDVIFENGKSLPKSGGENQLISLVFTAALIKHAKNRAKASGTMLLPGTIAPLFLDAPFGQLDQDYQVQAAKLLPELSDQLVLMLSNSQGNDHVLDALRPHVGSEFVIIRKSTEMQRPGQPSHEIDINGKTYVRALYGEEQNCSEIVRVET